MTLSVFELGAIGGPWQRKLQPRRRWIDEVLGDSQPPGARSPADLTPYQALWTRTAFSEYASAAAFAEISSAMLAAGAPIDLIAAAGDFIVDEIVHAEAAARVATWLGGALALEVDLERLVRPATADDPLVRAATLVVRTSCVGEAMTVPILKLARRDAGSPIVAEVLRRIVADESGHAQLGWWFLDWAAPRLDDTARAELGRQAGIALRAFAVVLSASPPDDASCMRGLGAVACADYDPAFATAASRMVAAPLAARGIDIPPSDLRAVGVAA